MGLYIINDFNINKEIKNGFKEQATDEYDIDGNPIYEQIEYQYIEIELLNINNDILDIFKWEDLSDLDNLTDEIIENQTGIKIGYSRREKND